jgi:cold shock CspA family protein
VKFLATVEAFNDARGDGVLVSDSGESFYFHCVSIANGSRHVDIGDRVQATRRVGHLGCDEADGLVTVF